MAACLLSRNAAFAKEHYECVTGPTKTTVPCTIFLVPIDYTQPILHYPSHTDVQAPAGSFDFRVGAPGLAMPTNSILMSEGKDVGAHRTVFTLESGGEVKIGPGLVPDGGAVQLLSLATSRLDVVFPQRERELPFPAGHLIAVVTPSPNMVSGVSDILDLQRAGVLTVTKIRPPRPGTANLVLGASYGAQNTAFGADISGVWLEGADKKMYRAAGATGKAPSMFYAVFFDLAAGIYKGHLESQHWQIDDEPIVLKPGLAVLDTHHTLTPASQIKAVFDVDPSLSGQRRTISVLRCREDLVEGTWPLLPDCTMVTSVAGTADQLAIEGVTPGSYFLKAELSGHFDGHVIQLKNGQDSTVLFRIRPVHVAGTLTRGLLPTIARMEFHHLDSETLQASTQSGPDGAFEVRIWTPGGYAINVDAGTPDAPQRSRKLVSISSNPEQRLDLDFPNTTARFHISDADTGQPITNATVACAGIEQGTDPTGTAEIDSLNPGLLMVSATAEHYSTARQRVQITDQQATQAFEITMSRDREELSFNLRLPSGLPPPDGRGYLGVSPDPINGMGTEFSCDPTGNCSLPYRPPDGTPMFLFASGAAITPTTTDSALTAGEIVLLAPGGPTRVLLTPGKDPSGTMVLGAVSVDGLTIPNGILRSCGNIDINSATSGSQLIFRTLPAGQISILLYALDLSPPSPHLLETLGAPLVVANTTPTTVTAQLP